MKMKLFGILLAVVFQTNAWAKVKEIKSFRELPGSVHEQTLVVFDLDNTVMEPVQMLGSDQWFDSLVKRISLKNDKEIAVSRALEIWEKVQNVTSMGLVEHMTAEIIRGYQKAGAQVVALTARPESLRASTLRQLSQLGVTFEEIRMIGPKKSKGESLKNWILELKKLPQEVFFIDDKVKHVNSVDQALEGMPLLHTEFRYGGADEQVKSFHQSLSDFEWAWFVARGELISDEEALEKCDFACE